jgi:hypothetical protein
MTGETWERPCYDTVNWSVVEDDSNLLYRVKEGSWTLSLVSTVVGSVTANLMEPWIKQKLQQRRQQPEEEVTELVTQLEMLVPFVNHADVFLGRRRPWIHEKLSDLKAFLGEAANLGDDIYDDMDHLGTYSSNELLQTLDFLISTNIALNDAGPTDVFTDTDATVDFSGDLIAVGGPIVNFYTRNLMYGDIIDLPYRYDLNPDDGSDETGDILPRELRSIGLTDNRGFDRRPNWCLVDENGEFPTISKKRTRPERRNDTWIRDYFTIIKSTNIHPDATAKHGENPTSLVLSGCHGFGTRAAITALKTDHVLETLQREVGDADFQAIGRVKRAGGPKIDGSQIVVPPEHVRVL